MTSHEKFLYYQNRVSECEVIDWLDGEQKCFSCHKNVYELTDEFTVKYGNITSCPNCHRSFLD